MTNKKGEQYSRVQDEPDLYRDENTGAVIRDNAAALAQFKRLKEAKLKAAQQHLSMKARINMLEKELDKMRTSVTKIERILEKQLQEVDKK